MNDACHSERRQPRIVVAGSINMDLVYRVSRLPQPGETLTGHSFQQVYGGKGANQAVAAARMRAWVTMIGRVGDDAFGTELVAGLQREAIDVSQIRTSPGTSSGLAVIGVEDSGQNCITVIPGANGLVTVDDILAAEAVIAGADVLLLQLEIPVESVMPATRIARRHNVLTILDPAPAPAEFPMELLHVDVVCPNESEAALITGLPVTNPAEAEAACRALRSLGAKVAIITMGSQGCVVCDESGQVHHIPAYPVTTIDTTAAGDAFAGALGYCLAVGQSVHEAACFASAAGALASTRPGAQPAMPQLADVAELRRLK
ncbi:MAG: ribokinase [Planctomycetaceae bacterium]|nr:ribokinase [Planctomycetaceae bacterium]